MCHIDEIFLEEIEKLQRGLVRSGDILFHGCAENACYIDVNKKLLMGTRKWFSRNAGYALDYSWYAPEPKDEGLLWVCKVKKDIVSFSGVQKKLLEYAPKSWSWPHQKFPDEFEKYAKKIIGEFESVGFVDDVVDEILITSPEMAIEVLELVKVDRHLKREAAEKILEKYRRCDG